MLGDFLRKGLVGDQDAQAADAAVMPGFMGLQGALMSGMQGKGFQMSPQQADMFGQYNNPMMFLRRL